MYTERYMGLPTPEDNLDSYRVSDGELDPFYNLFISGIRTFLSASILENIYFLFPHYLLPAVFQICFLIHFLEKMKGLLSDCSLSRAFSISAMPKSFSSRELFPLPGILPSFSLSYPLPS